MFKASNTGQWLPGDIKFRDLNGDGQINSGAELFGSSTKLADGSVASTGWAALAALDTNGDGSADLSETHAWSEFI